MADTMIRGMAANKQVRFFACNSTDTVEKSKNYTSYQSGCYERTRQTVDRSVLMGAMCKMIPTN